MYNVRTYVYYILLYSILSTTTVGLTYMHTCTYMYIYMYIRTYIVCCFIYMYMYIHVLIKLHVLIIN